MKTNHKVVSTYCDILQLVQRFFGIMKNRVSMHSEEAAINTFPSLRCIDK